MKRYEEPDTLFYLMKTSILNLLDGFFCVVFMAKAVANG